MSEWRQQKLTELMEVSNEIRRNQDEKKRIAKEYADDIKDLEGIRDALLDKLEGESGNLFDDEPTDAKKLPIELDEEPEEEDENEVPEPGTYLGDEPEEDDENVPDPEPPEIDPSGFLGE